MGVLPGRTGERCEGTREHPITEKQAYIAISNDCATLVIIDVTFLITVIISCYYLLK